MNPTSSEREVFEKAFRSINERNCESIPLSIHRKTNKYNAIAAQNAWELWQARTALDQRHGFVVTDEDVERARGAFYSAMANEPIGISCTKEAMRAALQSIATGK